MEIDPAELPQGTEMGMPSFSAEEEKALVRESTAAFPGQSIFS
jgi:hypothetical protein